MKTDPEGTLSSPWTPKRLTASTLLSSALSKTSMSSPNPPTSTSLPSPPFSLSAPGRPAGIVAVIAEEPVIADAAMMESLPPRPRDFVVAVFAAEDVFFAGHEWLVADRVGAIDPVVQGVAGYEHALDVGDRVDGDRLTGPGGAVEGLDGDLIPVIVVGIGWGKSGPTRKLRAWVTGSSANSAASAPPTIE